MADPPPRGNPAPGKAGSAEHWRGRVWELAARRRVPLPTILATVAVVVVAGFVLGLAWVLRRELLYVIVAVFIATLLTPPVRALERRGLTRGLAATLVFLLGLFVFAGLVFLFGVPLVSAVTRFVHQVPTLVGQAEHGRGQIGHLIRHFHLQRWVHQNLPKLSSVVANVSKPALSIGAAAASTLVAVVTIAILSFFLLLESSQLWHGFLRTLRPSTAVRLVRVANEVTRSVGGYVLGNLATSVIAGLLVMITLFILGVPYPVLLGLWVALVDLLPLVGGLLAGVPVVVIAFLHSPVAGIVILIVFLAYQQVENHVLNPLIMSRTVRLSPLWVLIAVLFAATLGGRIGGGFGAFIGALIGIPIGAALQVAFRELRRGPDAPDEAGMPGPDPPPPAAGWMGDPPAGQPDLAGPPSAQGFLAPPPNHPASPAGGPEGGREAGPT